MREQAGFAFVIILFILILGSALSLAFLQKAGIGTSATVTRGISMQAQYLAETAANHAMWRLINESDFPASESTYYMHSLAAGRYGYKVRRNLNATFATIAAVGVVGDAVVHQSYVLYIKGWYDPDWLFRQKITISPNVTDANLTDFPYIIKIDDAANGLFLNAQVDGEDILFTDSTHTTKLEHEIETYESFEGDEVLMTWVKIPQLSSSASTEIYMYYGNHTASNQENPTAVWSNDYEAVYHLHDDYNDSLAAHDGNNNGSYDVTGQLADGQDFYPGNGVDYIDIGNWSVSGDQLTIQAWVKSDDNFAQNYARVIAKANDVYEQNQVWMMSLYSGTVNNNRLRFRLKTGKKDSKDTTTLFGTNPYGYLPDAGNWYHVAMTYDGSQMQIIRDGNDAGSTGKSKKLRKNDWSINIGNSPGNSSTSSSSWDGKIDEVRISSVARSLDWIAAEYRNQGNTGAYISEDAEESVGTGAVVLEADFDKDEEGFVYTDDPFRGTAEPGYADSDYDKQGGYTAGALVVTLGGIDNSDIFGMSGGWEITFNLAADSEILLSFIYQLTMAAEYESDEYGQVLVSVDGALYGEGAGDYVVQVDGNGGGDDPDVTGWHRFSKKLGTLSAGDHTLIIGGYNNKKTYNDESVEILICDVIITK